MIKITKQSEKLSFQLLKAYNRPFLLKSSTDESKQSRTTDAGKITTNDLRKSNDDQQEQNMISNNNFCALPDIEQ